MDFFISEHLHRALCAPVRGKPERMCNCGMSSEHLVGTSIPRFTFDTPTKPGNDFYALCEGEQPLVMIFLPAFDHPVTREYLTHYLKTYARLRGVRLACVVRSSARTVAQATQGAEFPFPIICDAPGVLYSYLGVEQARGLRSWSFAAQRIYKTAKEQGYRYDSSAPQILPLTLVVQKREPNRIIIKKNQLTTFLITFYRPQIEDQCKDQHGSQLRKQFGKSANTEIDGTHHLHKIA